MNIDTNTGLLREARQVPSPNFNERPDIDDISLIVVHSISLPPNHFGGSWIDDLFTNQLDPKQHPYFEKIYQMQVSSHLLIRRDGDITQYVPFHKRAWHAGQSCYDGRNECNDFSIGIELEGCDEQNFEEAQYLQLAQAIDGLINNYTKLSKSTVTGHSDIAPGRKTDPGPCFEWPKLQGLLEKSN